MNTAQLTVFGVLAAMLVLFVWNRWRYDVVALVALLVLALAGIVPPDEAFMGLGHPAVVTVAAVLILSRGLLNAGVVDTIARELTRVGERRWIQVATLTAIVALCSGFINNVGALALFMPVGIWMSRRSGRSPSFLLMPLAFGSLLGGMLTMIGTPPNIIIAAYREEAEGRPFEMFDFLPVGLAVTLAGLLFIAAVGWRLTPKRENQSSSDDLFEISAYLTELRVPDGSRFAGRTLHELVAAVRDHADVQVIGLIRSRQLQETPPSYSILEEGDILMVEADSDNLKTMLDLTGLRLAEDGERANEEEKIRRGELHLAEAIVTPGSILIGRTAVDLDLRKNRSVNVLAVARQGQRLRKRLGAIRFAAGDILLLQGREQSLQAALGELATLPLASRGLRIAKPRKVVLATAIFVVALASIALGIPAATALVAAAVVMVLAGLLAPAELYSGIDLSIIVLLAALLPVGEALESTGGSRLIADGLLGIAGSVSPPATIAILMSAVMLLSNLINNAAAAVLAAPIAISLARGMEASADPFLMAVAIGSSCAFLTPIGHQSNTLVMEPGGYRFGDYWRMGLPLSVLVVATAVPTILWVWPLEGR